MTKKYYIILHIETGNIITPSQLVMIDGNLRVRLIHDISNASSIYANLNDLNKIGITRKDFVLKRNGIYFKDKISAISFLRDIYIPKTAEGIKDNWWWDGMRNPPRVEFEIVEVVL